MSQWKTRLGFPETQGMYGFFLVFLACNVAFPLCGLMLGTALPVYLTEAVHAPAWLLVPALTLSSLMVISCQTLVVRFLEPHRRTRAMDAAALVWCLSCSLFVVALFIPSRSLSLACRATSYRGLFVG